MEGIGDFADDLFADAGKRQVKISREEYKPKVLTPEWFNESATLPDDEQELVNIHIFCGDYLYYKENWSSAVDSYTSALELVAPNNSCLRRLVLESLARCKMKLGNMEEAIQYGEQLLKESTSENQIFTSHSALATVYHETGKIEDEIANIKACLKIRPLSAQHWIQLAKTQMAQLSRSKVKTAKSHLNSHREIKSRLNKSYNTDLDSNIDYKLSLDDAKTNPSDQFFQNNRLARNETDQCVMNTQGIRSKKVTVHVTQNSGSVGDATCNNQKCKGIEEEENDSQDINKTETIAQDINNETRDISRVTDKAESVPQNFVLRTSRNYGSGISKENIGKDGSNGDTEIRSGEVYNDRNMMERLNGRLENGLNSLSLDEKVVTEQHYENQDGVNEIASCLVKAKLILRQEGLAVISISKKRNDELNSEVERLIGSLGLDADLLSKLEQEISETIFQKLENTT